MLAQIASFISIGCSAFTLKSPREYPSVARTFVTSSSLRPYVARLLTRNVIATATIAVSASATSCERVSANAAARAPTALVPFNGVGEESRLKGVGSHYARRERTKGIDASYDLPS